MAESIMAFGVSDTRAKIYGGTGEFWVTRDVAEAGWFAASTQIDEGREVVIAFDLSTRLLSSFLTKSPPWVLTDPKQIRYEFFASSFPVLNRSMTNITMSFQE
jgi:hypothetical protein